MPSGKHELQAQDVVGGYAVGQRMRTAGVLRHIAADGAGALAGGIGRVEIALRLDGQRDIQIDHAGLHHRALVFQIDFEDAIHAREADDHAALARDRAAAQARPRAAAHDGHAVFRGDLDDGDDVFGAAREDHHLGPRLFHAAVVFVERQILGLIQVSARAQQIDQFLLGRGREHVLQLWPPVYKNDFTALTMLPSVQFVAPIIFWTTLPLESMM